MPQAPQTAFYSLALGFSLFFLSSSALCQPVLAQQEVKPYVECKGEPSESDVSAAKGAYQAGQVSFQESDYERSLLYWEDAFRRDCTAIKLLLNLARAYELSGDRPRAVNALQTYLDRNPDAPDKDSVEKRISKLNEQIAKDGTAPPPPVESKEDTAATDSPAKEATAPDEPKAKKPLWPLFLTGGGVVVALVGHALYQQGDLLRSDEADARGCDLDTNECPSSADTEAVNEAGKAERTAGVPVAVTGHLLAAAGGVLWYLTWTKDPKATAHRKTVVHPVVAPGYGGLTLSGTF